MKIKLIIAERAAGLYTNAVLRQKLKDSGAVLVDDIDRADYVMLSVCDPQEVSMVKKAKKEAGDTPIIMGGFESYFCIPYFAWVDYVVVGEGFDFIEKFGQNPEKALDMDCVMKHPDDTAVPNYNVRFREFPLVRVPGKNKFYYLAEKGCKRKCKFCATSWVQPYQKNSRARVKKVIQQVEKKSWGVVNLISNDSSRVYESSAINTQSVRVEDYLKEPKRYKCSMIHFGIEGWTEEKRKEWAKPLSNENIKKVQRMTKRHKQECEFFFIVGYPEWDMEKVHWFADNAIVTDTEHHPRIFCKLTYIDPMPHTPLADMKIDLTYCDPNKVANIFNSYSQRFRTFPTRSMARSAWRGVFHRCNPNEAIRLGGEPKGTNKPDSFDKFKEHLKEQKLLHRLEKPNKRYQNIETSVKK